mgnify:FL=1
MAAEFMIEEDDCRLNRFQVLLSLFNAWPGP